LCHIDKIEDKPSKIEKENEKYCPICQRVITPVIIGKDMIWIHDEIDHDSSDLIAMMLGLQ
jgi:hypothetical protein